jgi:hypothetical protein
MFIALSLNYIGVNFLKMETTPKHIIRVVYLLVLIRLTPIIK